MLNNGDGTFDSVSQPSGTASYALGWGCLFFDHDNDTHQALYVCNRGWANHLFDSAPGWPCPDIAPQMDVDFLGLTYNVSAADIDADGDLDLLVQEVDGNLLLYINHEGERRPWIRFAVAGEAPNRDAVGALLRVDTPGGSQISEVLIGGNNYRSQNELVQHFGLGEYCRTTSVQVDWPDGQQRTLSNYEAGHVWNLYPPSMLGDSNADGRVDAFDLHRLLASLGPVRPGLEALDMDGDAALDALDVLAVFDRMRAPR